MCCSGPVGAQSGRGRALQRVQPGQAEQGKGGGERSEREGGGWSERERKEEERIKRGRVKEWGGREREEGEREIEREKGRGREGERGERNMEGGSERRRRKGMEKERERGKEKEKEAGGGREGEGEGRRDQWNDTKTLSQINAGSHATYYITINSLALLYHNPILMFYIYNYRLSKQMPCRSKCRKLMVHINYTFFPGGVCVLMICAKVVHPCLWKSKHSAIRVRFMQERMWEGHLCSTIAAWFCLEALRMATICIHQALCFLAISFSF